VESGEWRVESGEWRVESGEWRVNIIIFCLPSAIFNENPGTTMMKIFNTLGVIMFVNIFTACFACAQDVSPPNTERVKAYEKLLPKAPRGVGAPISDRAVWDVLAKQFGGEKIIKEAEKMLKTPLPELTDDLYLDYSRTGNRDRCQDVIFKRQDRASVLALAECFENRGRFLQGIEEVIASICGEKTWVFPAHDGKLRNFKGEVIEIDLNSSCNSWNLATTAYWLGDKLSPKIKKRIADELERRTFTPFSSLITTGKPPMWWLTSKMNWNSVCLAGVTGAALTSIESPQRRAFFAASAEKYIQFFLEGFTPDGYCSEGVGYWNYGFGHYVMLSETIKQATGGKVDLLAAERIRPIALFGRRMEILPGVYPAFADAHVGVKPDPVLMDFLDRRFALGWKEAEKSSAGSDLSSRIRLFKLGIFEFNQSEPSLLASIAGSNGDGSNSEPLRDWFSNAGILICRPKPGSVHALGAALKGGHNAENHNHNDVGSFVVALDGGTPLLDPGSEVYTARTFGPNRYTSNVLNSYGHAVPRVAGTLQATGRDAQAKILKAEFTDDADTYVMDISSAYKVDELKKLERTFVFSREGAGKLTVTDAFEFERPENFGAALITFSKREQPAPDRLVIGEGNEAVEAVVSATGGKFRIDAQEIKENLPDKNVAVRLGIDFTQPLQKGSITVTITPK
jgi:hypothetical protein